MIAETAEARLAAAEARAKAEADTADAKARLEREYDELKRGAAEAMAAYERKSEELKSRMEAESALLHASSRCAIDRNMYSGFNAMCNDRYVRCMDDSVECGSSKGGVVRPRGRHCYKPPAGDFHTLFTAACTVGCFSFTSPCTCLCIC